LNKEAPERFLRGNVYRDCKHLVRVYETPLTMKEATSGGIGMKLMVDSDELTSG